MIFCCQTARGTNEQVGLALHHLQAAAAVVAVDIEHMLEVA